MTCRDVAEPEKVTKMAAEYEFYPSPEELATIRSWVIFNFLDILTMHIRELARFRPFVRSRDILTQFI